MDPDGPPARPDRSPAPSAVGSADALGIDATRPPPWWARAVAPDGRSIAFVDRGPIGLAPTTGDDAEPWTGRSFRGRPPVWSPDSPAIAFAPDRFGASAAFVAPVDGGSFRRLVHPSAPVVPVGFTPDRGDGAFAAARSGPRTEGDGRRRLGRSVQGSARRNAGRGWKARIRRPLPARRAGTSGDGRCFACPIGRSVALASRERRVSDAAVGGSIHGRQPRTGRQRTRRRARPGSAGDGRSDGLTAGMPRSGAARTEAAASTTSVWRRSGIDAGPLQQLSAHAIPGVRALSIADDGMRVDREDGDTRWPAAGSTDPIGAPVGIRSRRLLDASVGNGRRALLLTALVRADHRAVVDAAEAGERHLARRGP